MTPWERSLTHQLLAQHIFAERPRPLTYHDDMKRYNIPTKRRRAPSYATQNAALMILAIACAVSAVIITAGML